MSLIEGCAGLEPQTWGTGLMNDVVFVEADITRCREVRRIRRLIKEVTCLLSFSPFIDVPVYTLIENVRKHLNDFTESEIYLICYDPVSFQLFDDCGLFKRFSPRNWILHRRKRRRRRWKIPLKASSFTKASAAFTRTDAWRRRKGHYHSSRIGRRRHLFGIKTKKGPTRGLAHRFA